MQTRIMTSKRVITRQQEGTNMKARILLCTVVFASVITTSIAQSNVVTNVSVTLPGGGNYTLLANPLNNTSNDITTLFRSARDGDQIYRWNAVNQDLDGVGGIFPAYSALFGWNSHFV